MIAGRWKLVVANGEAEIRRRQVQSRALVLAIGGQRDDAWALTCYDSGEC